MKVIKIDVVKKEIYEIDFTPGLPSIYKELDCETFDVVYPSTLSGKDCVYVDDEGLFRDPPLGAFYIRGNEQVLSGHGLVVGTGSAGETVSPKTSLDKIKELVRFEDPHYLPEPGFTIINF